MKEYSFSADDDEDIPEEIPEAVKEIIRSIRRGDLPNSSIIEVRKDGKDQKPEDAVLIEPITALYKVQGCPTFDNGGEAGHTVVSKNGAFKLTLYVIAGTAEEALQKARRVVLENGENPNKKITGFVSISAEVDKPVYAV